MCGLHGMVTSNLLNTKYEGFITDAFLTNQVRGVDSSGIAVVRKGEVDLYKNAVGASSFVQERRTKDLVKQANNANTITMCHVRAATVGRITYDNAHPFWIADGDREIVGCHNGTLTLDSSEQNPYGTDSEWAIGEILDLGKDAFKKFKGAFAFTWWDSGDKDTFNIALNSQRDVHILLLKNGGMLYASEAGMLHWLAERNNLTADGPVRKLTPMHWYKFPVNTPDKYTKEAIPSPVYAASSTTTTTYKSSSNTHFDKLMDVFSSGKEENPKADTLVTASELSAAKGMGVIGKEGKFIPMVRDEKRNLIEGLVTFKDDTGKEHDCEAVIRGYSKVTLPFNVEWNVRVIGLKDYGNQDELVICSKPSVVLSAEEVKKLPVPLAATIN